LGPQRRRRAQEGSAVMGPRELPLRSGWFGPTLPGVRELPDAYATYALFPPDALPPLEVALHPGATSSASSTISRVACSGTCG
jgi:hypothetical protein